MSPKAASPDGGMCTETTAVLRRRLRAASAACAILVAALHGEPPGHGKFSDGQSARLDSIAGEYYVKHCCGASIGQCVSLKGARCPIANHLYGFAAWLVEIECEPQKIMKQIGKRYAGFVDKHTFSIDTSAFEWAGDTSAPVAIVAYLSSSCNLCKHIVAALYDSVTTGSLSGKAKLMAKPLGTGVGDVALVAANTQGKFWSLLMAMREDKSRYSESTVVRMGRSVGIDAAAFRAMLHADSLHETARRSREEGIRNGVRITPTFFINSKRYRSYKDPRWVVDAALYEHGAHRSP